MGQFEISYDRAHWMFSYEEDTGVLRRKVTVSSRAMRGESIRAINSAGYVVVRFEGVLQYAHRIIWLMKTGNWPVNDIDHIDGNPSNNRFDNLRDVPRAINLQNKIVASGVYYAHRDKVWVATIEVNGVQTRLGQSKSRAIAEAIYRGYKVQHSPVMSKK